MNDRQFTSAVCASTVCDGLLVLLQRVSQIISFWSSATDPNKDSCSKCQATSWNGQYAVRDVTSIWARLLRIRQSHIYIQKKRIKQYTYLNQLHTNYTLMTNNTFHTQSVHQKLQLNILVYLSLTRWHFTVIPLLTVGWVAQLV